MEGFLEANRIVETSLEKLGRVSKGSEMSLRKALLVSKTLCRAQTTAETVQNSLMTTDLQLSRSSSKLLASMQSAVSFEEDTAVSHSDLQSRSNQKVKHQPVSPIVTSTNQLTHEAKDKEDDVMEYISKSVLSNIFTEDDMECSVNDDSSWVGSSVGVDSSSHWSPLVQTMDSRDTSPPPSPIKRQHNVAFPAKDEPFSSIVFEDSKRFKFSSPGISNSLPGFCDHLSPKNLCSAPLITYMFGKGFGVPSNPLEMDWPRSHSDNLSSNSDLYSVSPSKLLPVLAY